MTLERPGNGLCVLQHKPPPQGPTNVMVTLPHSCLGAVNEDWIEDVDDQVDLFVEGFFAD
jgi:hypothetical protein